MCVTIVPPTLSVILLILLFTVLLMGFRGSIQTQLCLTAIYYSVIDAAYNER